MAFHSEGNKSVQAAENSIVALVTDEHESNGVSEPNVMVIEYSKGAQTV